MNRGSDTHVLDLPRVYMVRMMVFIVLVGILAAIYLAEYRSDRLGPAVRFIGELLAGVLQFPTTRFNGSGGFSSGFGRRVNIAAPSDGIVALMHACSFRLDGVTASVVVAHID